MIFKRAACMLSVVRIMEVVSCQNNGSCHLSEWTFVELSLVRMDFCRNVTCQNGLLQNCHLSEWTFLTITINYIIELCYECPYSSMVFGVITLCSVIC